MSVLVTVYSRPGCHLCEDALAVVHGVASEVGARVEVIDIESDDALLARYLERIPVVAIGGTEQFEFVVEDEALRRAIANLGSRS